MTLKDGSDIVYDNQNRVIYSMFATGERIYFYDAGGRLAEIREPGRPTGMSFVREGRTLVEVHEHGNLLTEFHLGFGQEPVLSWEDWSAGGPQTQLVLSDHRKSPVATFDMGSYQLSDFVTYDSDGRPTFRSVDSPELEPVSGPAGPFPLQFSSAWVEPTTGLSHMDARWYSPDLAMFTTRDPLGYIDSYNPFAFAGNDPINYWDPTGLEKEPLVDPLDSIMTGDFNNNYSADNPGSANFGAGVQEVMEDTLDGAGKVGRAAKNTVNKHCSSMICAIDASQIPDTGRGVAFGLAMSGGGAGFGAGKGMLKGGFSAGRMRKGLASDLKIDADLLPCSFTEETVVEMCDGSLKQISEVQEGEEVLTRDQLTGDLSCRPVVHPYSNPDRAIIELTLLDEDGDFEVLETTDNHPFFVLGRGWTRVDELEIGDLVPSPDGQLEVVGLVWTGELETVYNFGVEEHRSYFVGELGAWVHNCDIPFSSKTVRDAFKDIDRYGQLHVFVDSADEAGELFLRKFQGEGYRNSTGFSSVEAKDFFLAASPERITGTLLTLSMVASRTYRSMSGSTRKFRKKTAEFSESSLTK